MYNSQVATVLRLCVCSVGDRARRMPSFPWGVSSVVTHYVGLVLPATGFATAYGAGCHLWGARGRRLVSDCGLPGPLLIGLLCGPL